MSEGGGDFSVPAAFVPGKRRIAKPPGEMPGGLFGVSAWPRPISPRGRG